MNYRAVLFDFDGTLAPSLPLWVKAYHIAFHHYGLAFCDEEILRRCMFRDWAVVAADFAVCSAEELERQVHAGLRQAFAAAVLFPLAKPLVEHCRAHGLQTALVTSSPRTIVVDVIVRLHLAELFDFVICGNDVKNYKPHPEPVLTTLAALKRLPAEAIMVGDSHADILAGKAAGTHTALFLPEDHGRFHSTARLRATEPDHIFADHGELPALLGLPRLDIDHYATT
jgi:HAD superfamily hydrolase (TIGR01509 family)